MFQFDQPVASAETAPVARERTPTLGLSGALAVAERHSRMILSAGVLGAIAVWCAAGALTPKYIATSEIFVDPGSAQGSTTDPITPGQDANGFVNYVETQKLIVASRSVMERVVRAQGLDHNPEFIGSAAASLFGDLINGRGAAGDPVVAAIRTLSSRLQVTRPERTFVLNISVSDPDPARAAELSNATAKAYIEEIAQMRSDGSRQTGQAIADRLEALRLDVIKAEQEVETYRNAHNLTGARDVSSLEVQLHALQDQMATQRGRESDALSRTDGAEAARKNPADLSAFATQFGLMTLSPLRAQQAEAHQKLADARASLGPRHPQAIEAEARAKSADDAVDSELGRFARSQRLEYQRAKAAQADLQRQIDTVMAQTSGDDQALIGLRDLERRAQATREVYELFVQRSRDTGAIQEIGPTRTKIISAASPPKARAFPPGAMTLAGLGFVAGLGLGFLAALAGDGLLRGFPLRTSSPPDPPPTATERELPPSDFTQPEGAPSYHLLGARSRLFVRPRAQTLEGLELAGLGFPALARGADRSDLRELIEALPRGRANRQVIVVSGDNASGDRTALAINLAIFAAGMGAHVALLDASGRNARLTRAVRLATRKTVLDGGPAYDTSEGVRLILPKAGDPQRGRLTPLAVLTGLIDGDGAALIVLDGPDPREQDARELLALATAVVALDDGATAAALVEIGVSPDAIAAFAEAPVAELKRA